jgi:hypothetical protein
MSTEERGPVTAASPPAKVTVTGLDKPTPANDRDKPTNRMAYDLDCKVCGRKAGEDCTVDCTRLKPGNPNYHHRYKSAVVHQAQSAAKTPTPRKSAKDIVLGQSVGDTGYPRIDQAELLNMPSVKQLLQMLTYMRPAGTPIEEEYIKKYISDLPNTVKDKYGNRWVTVKKPGGSDPDLIFSSHTDTVHHQAGKQTVLVGDGRAWTDQGSCLGADDTVGNWLMIEMINAKVPGLYLFHREEEIGGKGSAWIVKNRGTKIKDKFKAVIALDRKGYHDIITHQGGRRTCSDKFARSLNAILGAKMTPSTGGTFTDSKNYIELVGECTNVSVGYHAQHGPTEWTELSFAVGLRDALVNADWSKLEFERKPGETSYSGYGAGYYGRGVGGYDDADWDMFGLGGGQAYGNAPKSNSAGGPTSYTSPIDAKTRGHIKGRASAYSAHKRSQAFNQMEDLLSFVRLWPDTVAHFLAENGFEVEDIENFYLNSKIPGKKNWDAD